MHANKQLVYSDSVTIIYKNYGILGKTLRIGLIN